MPLIRTFSVNDAAALSALIQSTIESSNSLDYPLERLQPLIDYFHPARIIDLNAERYCLVAQEEGSIIGTAAIEHDRVVTFFVHTQCQRKGVGTALLRALEDGARQTGLKRLTVEASLTGTKFYERQGYARTGKILEGTAGPQIELEKLIG